MNHRLISLFAAPTALLIPAANAFSQTSNVTLFGVADSAVRIVQNEGLSRVTSVVSGSNSTSRWGLRGSEDIGSGVRASFWLESGIAVDTGAVITNLFDRRATVSLSSASIGELRLGRDFVPTYRNWGQFDVFSYVGVAASSQFVSSAPAGPIRTAFGTNANTTVRSSNFIQYFTPRTLGGFEGELTYAPDEGGTAANGNSKVIGARVGYSGKQAVVSAAYMTTETSLNPGKKFKDRVVGGSYDFGVAKLTLAHREFQMLTAKQRIAMIGLTAPVGSGELRASFINSDMSGTVGASNVSATDGKMFALGYVYNLSKRTAAYGTYARITNSSTGRYAVSGGATVTADGKNSSGLEIGLRHTF